MLMSGRQYIDVVGLAKPWPIPPAGGSMPANAYASSSLDPRAGATQSWTNWPEQTRDTAPFLQNLAMSLGGYVAIFAGEFAQFPEQVVEEFLAPDQRREPLAARNWYMTDCEWPLFLFKYAGNDPQARRGALELSYECVQFLAEVGPLPGPGERAARHLRPGAAERPPAGVPRHRTVPGGGPALAALPAERGGARRAARDQRLGVGAGLVATKVCRRPTITSPR